MTDKELRDTICKAYREGRQSCIRVGILLEQKRVQLGGTTRGGFPVKSKFWRWFEEQDFPFARKTAENYMTFARKPELYELHCERVRRKSRERRTVVSNPPDIDSRRVGLANDVYDALVECAHKRQHTINQEIEEAVMMHLAKHLPDQAGKVSTNYRSSDTARLAA